MKFDCVGGDGRILAGFARLIASNVHNLTKQTQIKAAKVMKRFLLSAL